MHGSMRRREETSASRARIAARRRAPPADPTSTGPRGVSAFIEKQKATGFAGELICRTLEVSRSAYYQRATGRRSARAACDEQMGAVIRQVHEANFEAYGYRKLHLALRRQGVEVGRDRVKRLMRQNGIRGAKRRASKWKTTTPDPHAGRRPDLVERDFTASRPDELDVADLTYLRCWEGQVFLAFVIDVFSRRVVGRQLASHMRASLVCDALRMAVSTRSRGADVVLVHHSDRRIARRIQAVVATLDREELRWAGEDALRNVRIEPRCGRRGGRRPGGGSIACGSGSGLSSEDAAVQAGVSPAVGVRWFREGGGMPSVALGPPSGRYLSFAERDEIALLRAERRGVREIARQLGRSPSPISTELWRNTATRSGGFEYRASTAQWHADRRARRPKPARLAVNDELRRYPRNPARLMSEEARRSVPRPGHGAPVCSCLHGSSDASRPRSTSPRAVEDTNRRAARRPCVPRRTGRVDAVPDSPA
jgi:transposase InsO family protein